MAAVRERGIWAATKAAVTIINPLSRRRVDARRRAALLRLAQSQANAQGCVIRRVHGSLMALDVRHLQSRSLEADLAVNGTREPGSTIYYLSVLHELKRRWKGRKPIILDVGANVGYYALMAANVFHETARIVAIEPDDDNAARLRRNIDLNCYASIEVCQAAAGASLGTGRLSRQSASNWHKMEEVANAAVSIQDVATLTIDSILDGIGDADSPVIIRMDIEGYEGHAFRGMSQLLTSGREVFVFVELHREAAGLLDEMIAALRSGGFYVNRLEAHSGIIETGVDLTRLADVKIISHAFLSKGLGTGPLANSIMV